MLFFAVASCKTQKIIPTEESVDKSLKSEEIIRLHQAAFPKFETLSGNVSIDFDNGNHQQTLPFTLRMKKNEAIWLSAPLGIAKAYLTPEKIQFYNKMDNSYFDGDYSLIENMIGVELNYQMLENLLFGQLVLQANSYEVTPSNTGFLCESKSVEPFGIQSVINSGFRVENSLLTHKNENLNVRVAYSYQTIENQLFPSEISVKSHSERTQTTITISFENIELNRQLNFPFKIPSGYKSLIFNK